LSLKEDIGDLIKKKKKVDSPDMKSGNSYLMLFFFWIRTSWKKVNYSATLKTSGPCIPQMVLPFIITAHLEGETTGVLCGPDMEIF